MKTIYEQVIALYQDGMTDEQIAKKLGLPFELVTHCIEVYNSGEVNE